MAARSFGKRFKRYILGCGREIAVVAARSFGKTSLKIHSRLWPRDSSLAFKEFCRNDLKDIFSVGAER